MNTIKMKWAALLMVLAGSCWGVSCGASFRDAAMNGMLDFTTSAVTQVLEKLVPVDTMLGA